MAALDLQRAAGIKMNHVPYKGEGPAVVDLLGKHVDMLFGTNAVASTHNLRRLAVAADKRSPDLPDVPALAELGYNVSWAIVGGAVAPKNIDAAAKAGLEKACATATASRPTGRRWKT
jgi:tripartite-type tricarboxylate transporter receptor subunit TctC